MTERDDVEFKGDEEPTTFEGQMLAHAERQTKALESMQTIMWGWSAVLVIAVILAFIVLVKTTA
jgi:hypothetical protein